MHTVPERHADACPLCGRDSVEPAGPPTGFSGRFFMPGDLTVCHCGQCRKDVARFTRSGLITNGFMSLASIAAVLVLLFHSMNMLVALGDRDFSVSYLFFALLLAGLAAPFALYALLTGRILASTLYHGLATKRPAGESRWEITRAILFSTLFLLGVMGVVSLSDQFDIHMSGFVEILTGCMLLLIFMISRYFNTRARITGLLLLFWLVLLSGTAFLLTDHHHPFSMTVRDLAWRFESIDGSGRGLLLSEDDHRGPVNAVAISTSGAVMASASRDGTVKLWSSRDGTLYTTFHCDMPVVDVQFSPDSLTLGALTTKGDIFLWDVATYELLLRLDEAGHTAMSFSPDSGLLTIRGTGMTLRSAPYQLVEWNAKAPFPVREARFSDTGQALLASFSEDEERGLAVWRVSGGTPVGEPEFIGGQVRAFAPLGGTLVAMSGGTPGAPLLLWEHQSRQIIGDLGKSEGFVETIAVNARHRFLAVAGENVRPMIWDGSTGLRAEASGHKGNVRAVALSPDGKRLVTGDDSGAVRIWNIEELFRR